MRNAVGFILYRLVILTGLVCLTIGIVVESKKPKVETPISQDNDGFFDWYMQTMYNATIMN